jgi:hypothetical protein
MTASGLFSVNHRILEGFLRVVTHLPKKSGTCGSMSLPGQWRFAFLVTLCFFLAVFPARAFVGQYDSNGHTQRWALVNLNTSVHTNVVNRGTRAVRYYVATDAYTTTNRPAEYNAVRASFAQLQAVPGTVLKFEDAGLSPAGMDINTADHTNVVFWAKTSTLVNGGNDSIAGALAVCFVSMSSDNTLVGADVVFNGVQQAWTADYFAASVDNVYFIEAVLIHELGHFIGLGHSPAGGATMLPFGDVGVTGQFGLATDDISGVRALYGTGATMTNLAHLQGTVTKGGNPVLGVAVWLEDTNGAMTAATVTRSNGRYHFPCVPPATYRVRATPLDPAAANYRLVTGQDIDGQEYGNADLLFLCSSNYPVTLSAGVTSELIIPVVAASPPFRITLLRTPTSNPSGYEIASLPISVRPGQSNLTVGVFSEDLPSSGATLSVTGSGITFGAQTIHPMNSPFSGLAGISVVVNVASNAAPGMRSLVVTRGTDVAYANGYLVIPPLVQDNNFDGLDDRFQRQYFPLFTSSQAAPSADPDGDGMNNQSEYVAGTVPTNAVSVLKLDSLTQSAGGTTIRWRSVVGKKYQVLGRAQVTGAPWLTLGTPVTANGAQAQYLDAGATTGLKFYRVQVLP